MIYYPYIRNIDHVPASRETTNWGPVPERHQIVSNALNS
jgi:hypothetical protein